MHHTWKTFNGIKTSWDDIIAKIKESKPNKIYIGSDSQIKGQSVKYITVIALLFTDTDGIGHGGAGWYKTEYKQAHVRQKGSGKTTRVSLRERLTRETWMSIGASYEFMKEFETEDGNGYEEFMPTIEIHCDVASNVKMESNKVAPEIIGLVEGQGFDCKIKPESWCSMEVADRYSK